MTRWRRLRAASPCRSCSRWKFASSATWRALLNRWMFVRLSRWWQLSLSIVVVASPTTFACWAMLMTSQFDRSATKDLSWPVNHQGERKKSKMSERTNYTCAWAQSAHTRQKSGSERDGGEHDVNMVLNIQHIVWWMSCWDMTQNPIYYHLFQKFHRWFCRRIGWCLRGNFDCKLQVLLSFLVGVKWRIGEKS